MKYFLPLVFIFMTHNALAGDVTGEIAKLKVRNDGLHWVFVAGTNSNLPACSIYGKFVIKDENTTYGKSQFSMLVTAFAAGKDVTILGNNVCTRYPSLEDISAIQFTE